MAADKQNLQDVFLNHVRKEKIPVTIFLINGVKLQGVITTIQKNASFAIDILSGEIRLEGAAAPAEEVATNGE